MTPYDDSQQLARAGMTSTMHSITIGYVPSLEAIPFAEWASEGGIRMQSCPGYGNMVRALLTGAIEAGVIPWELFVSDLLSRPGQTKAWKIPAVLKACPLELVLSQSARKLVFPMKRTSRATAMVELIFGVEARHSFTKRQIVAWIESLNSRHLAPPRFKVLPMKLLVKGLKMGEVDGLLAPSPWGLHAEVEGSGRLEPSFEEGELGQNLVLVCNAGLLAKSPEIFRNLTQELVEADALGKGSKNLPMMPSVNAPPFSADLLALALTRYPLDLLSDEFVPDVSWFEKELRLLVSRRAISIPSESIREIAATLTCAE